jgi:hypothetical protein
MPESSSLPLIFGAHEQIRFTRCASESLLCWCKEVTKKAPLFVTYGVFAECTSVCTRRTARFLRALKGEVALRLFCRRAAERKIVWAFEW